MKIKMGKEKVGDIERYTGTMVWRLKFGNGVTVRAAPTTVHS